MPTWVVALAEILALGLLGVTFWFIAKPQYRRRIPAALAVIAVLALVQTRIQERSARVAAWLIVLVSLTLAVSALGRRGRLYADYWRIAETYGPKSKQMTSYVMKVVARVVIIMIILMALSAIFIKGTYTQGT
jgi:hypothetical protein